MDKMTQEKKTNMMKDLREWMSKYDVHIASDFCENVYIESDDCYMGFFEILDIESIDKWLLANKSERKQNMKDKSQTSLHPEFQKHTEIISDPDRDSKSFDAKIVQAIQEPIRKQFESFEKKMQQAIQEQSKRFDKRIDDMHDGLDDSVNRLHRSIRQNRNSILDLEEYRDMNFRGNFSMRGYNKGYRSLQDSISEPRIEEL